MFCRLELGAVRLEKWLIHTYHDMHIDDLWYAPEKMMMIRFVPLLVMVESESYGPTSIYNVGSAFRQTLPRRRTGLGLER